MSSVIHGLVAIGCVAGGIAIASAHPIAPFVALAVFSAWTVLAFTHFSIAWPALLALIPIAGFAMFTGWLTFEEIDFLILASAAGGHAALAMRPQPRPDADTLRFGPKLSVFSIAVLLLFGVSLVISLERGIAAAGGFRFDWFQTYDDPLNSVRVFKSYAWALLMAPLLFVELRKPGAMDRLSIGLVAALALESLVVVQERLAFTGLLDFSDDYRVTGSFWEMHIGGAALDGFLALCVPFAVREVIRHADRWRYLFALGTLGIAAYACLVTFSRAVYLAIPVSMLLLVILVYRQRVRTERRALWHLIGKGFGMGLMVAASGFVVFKSGGYRATLATFAVLVAAVPVEAAIRRSKPSAWCAAAVAAVLLGLAGHALASVLPKGPYLVFAMAFAACAATTVVAMRRPGRTNALLSIASWLWLAVDACLVALHWGGVGAAIDGALVMTALVVVSFVSSLFAQPLWPERRSEQIATLGFAALVMGSVAVFTAGAYMGARFQSTSEDLDARVAHWSEGLRRLHDVDDWLFGRGLGRFPATSHFESIDTMSTGLSHMATRDGERFLALTGPRLRYLGFDELYRVTQRVDVKPGSTYVLSARARSAQKGELHVELCEKQLLYHGACVTAATPISADAKRWTTITFPLKTDMVGASSGWWPRPVNFGMSNGVPDTTVEVGEVHLVGPDGIDLLSNGDFANRTARWFTSSDKYHLPWHIKNIALGVLLDQGAIGLALFSLLLTAALVRTSAGRAFRHPDAPYLAVALAGYFVVGTFDTLLDVPRVAFLFYMLVLTALMLRNPRAVVATKVAAVEPDESASRAARRQKAFGTRRASPTRP